MSDFIVTPAAAIGGDSPVPGDKSIGHRAFLFGALTDGRCAITGLSGGEDNRRTAAALVAMGVRVEEDLANKAAVVYGVGLGGLRAPAGPLDCGNSGTTMRLFCGLLAGQPFTSTLIGDPSLSKRPMRRVITPLATMGAKITGRGDVRPGDEVPPLIVTGGPLVGRTHHMTIASAQVKSALVLAGLQAKGPTEIHEPGPTRDHTERILGGLGAPISTPSAGVVRVEPDGWDRRLRARDLSVPGDPSSAAFLIAAGALWGGTVRVPGVCLNPTRTGFVDALLAFGARVGSVEVVDVAGEPVGTLEITGGAALTAATIDGPLVVRAIDEIPVLMTIAARAQGTTVVAGAEELRVKESDRVATTVAMLRAFGVEAEERPDGLVVHGRPDGALRPAEVDAHGDHRIAMAAAVLALGAPGPTTIHDVDNVATSFPGFEATMARLGAVITRR